MATPLSTRILLVEDEQDIQELISLHLTREGYVVQSFDHGEEALSQIQKEAREAKNTNAKQLPYDLFILDWMLPGMSGLDITKTVRHADNKLYHPALRTIPILMVTARMEPNDIILGLESGADDYVTKPFEIPVLIARVKALLRRTNMGLESGGVGGELVETGKIQLGQEGTPPGVIIIDLDAHQVRCDGELADLTPSEFKLLHALAQNRGRVLTRDRLIECVQGAGVVVIDRAIDTHVFGLRKKLGACAELIETVRGVGYRIRADL